MINLFISYSHRDEELRDELETHLSVLKRSGLIRAWHDRRIPAGKDVNREISDHLEAADVILLLLSPYFLASDYAYGVEAQRALQRHEAGSAVVIPVIIQPCDWLQSPFGKLRATPRDGKPVASFSNMHEALLQVTQDIRAAAQTLGKSDQSQLGISRSILASEPGRGASDVIRREMVADRPDASFSPSTASINVVSVNQRTAQSQSYPANPLGVAGQIDVIVSVDRGDQLIERVVVALEVGASRVTQTLVDPDALAAVRAGQSLLTFGFNTAAFNATTGVPMLPNGPMTVAATVRLTDATSATSTVPSRLANADFVIVIAVFTPYTNAQGAAIPMRTTDEHGSEWRHGSVTIVALPVLYSGREIASLSITLPGADIPTQVLTSPPYTATWLATTTSNNVPNVSGRVLAHPTLFESNGITPNGVVPTVVATDVSGNDIPLAAIATNGTFRLDNRPT